MRSAILSNRGLRASQTFSKAPALPRLPSRGASHSFRLASRFSFCGAKEFMHDMFCLQSETQTIGTATLRRYVLLRSARLRASTKSENRACLAKVEPRSPRQERCRIAITDVAEKI